MAVGDPVLFDEDGETFCGAVVGVEANLRERRELRGAIPAVGAVHEDVRVGEMDRSSDDENAVEDVGEVGEPVGLAKGVAIHVAVRLGLAEGCN